jgi:hypothetical protein
MTNPFLLVAFLYCLKKSYEARAFRPWGLVALLVLLGGVWAAAGPGQF